ncbi:MAG: DNA polymerase III subunit chi [Halieaceae bacterium]|nr:DNA polymerase III subunit chi [Halieaceae bacterium]
MTRVDFYVVADSAKQSRLSVAARLVDKAYPRGHRIYIHCDSEQQARDLDTLLWTYRRDSFLPHATADADRDAPILIDWTGDPGDHNDVMINLQLTAPSCFSRFNRVAEVVTQDPEFLPALRDAWRFYQDRGYPLHKHDL